MALEPTAPAVTAPPVTAPPVTAPAVTAPAVAAPPEPTFAELVEELWVNTGYCWSTCDTAYTPQEWVAKAEVYGLIDTDEFVDVYEYLATTTSIEMDSMCTEFWDMPDSEVAQLAFETDSDPAAWILNLYVWCDS